MEFPSLPAGFNRMRQLFWLFLLLTIGYMIWAQSYLYPLSSGEIVQLEIAKTAAKAKTIILDWKNTGKYEQGVKSTYFAFLFIVLYTIAIGVGCRFIAACTGNEILTRGGMAFAWLIVVATICDIIENITMFSTLRGNIEQYNVSLAYHLAHLKFSIVIVCLLFMFTCSLYWLIGRLAGGRK